MSKATPVTAENTFSLAGKQLKLDTAKDINSYLGDLAARKNVVKIDLSGNTIGIEASEALAQAILKHSETIEEINFSDIYTGRLNTEIPQSLDHILNAFLQCPNLTTIDLSDNALGMQAIEPVEAWLAKAVSMEHLILANNGMGPLAGARIGKSLFKLAQEKKKMGRASLKTFICGRNRLENGSINYLAIGLRAHKDLETVRLYQNGIRPAGIAKLLLQGLSQNSNLKVVDLQDNTITTSAVVGLVRALESWPNLVELNLNDCLLKSKGSLLLADKLAEGDKRPSFEVLKLQYNELEVDALKKIAVAVEEKLPNLKLLELNGNRFEEDSEYVDAITAVFEKRGSGELDELDDLEEIDSEEEDEEDDEEDPVVLEEDDSDLNQLEKELAGISVEDADKNVDALADELASTHIKN